MSKSVSTSLLSFRYLIDAPASFLVGSTVIRETGNSTDAA